MQRSELHRRPSLHLVRRVWACGEANAGSFDGCEYNGTKPRASLVQSSLWRWTASRLFVVMRRELRRRRRGRLRPQHRRAGQLLCAVVRRAAIEARPRAGGEREPRAKVLRDQIDLFRDAFILGEWTLWNGNNWTPHLVIAALMWAVAFYHEDAVAPEVVEMVNDILWLHRPYYTPDGVYKEGVIQYSVMSITGLIQSAVVQRASFGAAPMAIDVTALERVVAYMLASMPTDGYAVDFGDSHAKRGWGDAPSSGSDGGAHCSGTSLSDADAAIDGCPDPLFFCEYVRVRRVLRRPVGAPL